MGFKKGFKAVKKVQPKVEEVEEIKTEVIEEETPVTSVVENEIKNEEVVETKKSTAKVFGTVWDSKVVKPIGRIKFEAQVAPYPMFKLPAELRNYLISKGFTTEVYKKDKEWLERHHADMKMIEALKKFLTERL